MTQIERELIPIEEYYTTEGKNVYLNRKIGDGKWEKILTPYDRPPVIYVKWMSKQEIEALKETTKGVQQ